MAKFVETAVAEYASKVIALQGQGDRVFKRALNTKKIRDRVKQLNTEIQLRAQSVDSEGNKLFNTLTQRSVYSNSDPLGRGGQPYQVFRTGEYYESFIIRVGEGEIRITSDPIKSDNNLFEVYTTNLEGLTEQSLQLLIDDAIEEYINWFRRELLPQ